MSDELGDNLRRADTTALRADTAALRADTATIATFGRDAGTLAARLHDAAAHTRDGDPAPLAPILGPVGASFLTALTATHLAHERDLDRLGDAFAGMGSAATASAAAYERVAAETTRRLRNIRDHA